MTDPAAAVGRRILLLDGEPGLAEALAAQLRRLEGTEVECAGSAEAALDRVQRRHFDLAIVGLPLSPTVSGTALAALRVAAPGLAILVLASGDDAPPPELAADEVVARPFRLAHLLSRLEALLARRAAQGSEDAAIGPFRFRPDEKRLIDGTGTREIRLTEKEVAILDYLTHAEGRITSRELLLNEVWGYNSGVTTHTLETHVYRLRQKIEADPANAEILISEPGGYRLATVLGGLAMDETGS